MQGRRWVAGAFGLGLALLALAPASAWALEAPVIMGLEPNEIGSNGSGSVIVHCEHCAAVTSVRFGPVILRHKASGVLGKGEWKALSETEIEVNFPFHEHGKAIVRLCVAQGAEEACSPAAAEPTNTLTILPEVYKNEVPIGVSNASVLGYGELELNSPQINTQTECVNLGFGKGWNEAPSGQTNPITGHGEILTWWASGHAPKSSHTELSSRCRFVYNGTEENQPTSPTAWATAEPPLHEVIQEGEVCARTGHQLIECRISGEEKTEIRSVIREVSREPASVPWNVGLTEKSERLRAQIGLPLKCKPSERTELTEGTEELERCPQASEREVSKSPTRCNIPPTPAPPGCVKVDIVSPQLNLQLEYEGYLEPKVVNGGSNGLSPSQWEFEGSAAGEPALHLSETPTTEGSTTGNVKFRGSSGQELITLK